LENDYQSITLEAVCYPVIRLLLVLFWVFIGSLLARYWKAIVSLVEQLYPFKHIYLADMNQ